MRPASTHGSAVPVKTIPEIAPETFLSYLHFYYTLIAEDYAEDFRYIDSQSYQKFILSVEQAYTDYLLDQHENE